MCGWANWAGAPWIRWLENVIRSLTCDLPWLVVERLPVGRHTITDRPCAGIRGGSPPGERLTPWPAAERPGLCRGPGAPQTALPTPRTSGLVVQRCHGCHSGTPSAFVMSARVPLRHCPPIRVRGRSTDDSADYSCHRSVASSRRFHSATAAGILGRLAVIEVMAALRTIEPWKPDGPTSRKRDQMPQRVRVGRPEHPGGAFG